MFGSPRGRKFLARSTKCNRLAVITMHKKQTYGRMSSVQEEVSEAVQSMAPKGHKGNVSNYLLLVLLFIFQPFCPLKRFSREGIRPTYRNRYLHFHAHQTFYKSIQTMLERFFYIKNSRYFFCTRFFI